MKTIHVFLPALLVLFAFAACGPQPNQEDGGEAVAEETQAVAQPLASAPEGSNSRNALDWDGVYTGTVPCADCEGIKTMIQLNKDETYTLKTKYLGKSDEVFTASGKFTWNDAGSIITLEDAGSESQSYQVGENILFHLDQDGNRVTGDLAEKYRLRKQQKSLVGKRWKLIEIMGKPVAGMDLMKEPFIELTGEADGWRFAGNDGCNNIMGSYEMGDAGTISFSKPASTLMACPKGDLQQEMTDVLGQADNFTMSEDGATLSLNKARMAPLARFEVDYMGGE